MDPIGRLLLGHLVAKPLAALQLRTAEHSCSC
jgi:hypothetical protein